MSEKIVVIGAGITGLFTTLYLSRNGYDVTLDYEHAVKYITKMIIL